MKKYGLLIGFCCLLIGSISPTPSHPPSTPRSYAQSTTEIGLYEKFEITFEVPAVYENPYDTAEVDVQALFVSPSGDGISVPAFYMIPYEQTCIEDCTAEVLQPINEGEWHLRFTPTELGDWRYVIRATGSGVLDDANFLEGRFTVVESPKQGFIQVAPNQHYFAFSDGSSYFPIGHNLAWSWENGGGIFTYIEWLDKLAAAGANYARLFIDIPWFIGLEWTLPAGQYGRDGQIGAWRLDTILEAAEARGIYLQLTLIWSQAFRYYNGPPVNIPTTPARPAQDADFDNHPYNNQLNGSLQNPSTLFIDSISKRFLESRFRYIAARWGYSPAIMGWEIIDNYDNIEGFSVQDHATWLDSLIETLREFDPNQHLITIGTRRFQPLIQENPLLDFTQARLYQSRPIEQSLDQVTRVLEVVNQARTVAPRPTLLTEYSLNPWFEPTNDDPLGIHIQNTLWATTFSGAAGSGMSWWWDTYLDPQNLYTLYTPLALFTQNIPWSTSDLAPIEVGLTSLEPISYETIRIDDFNRLYRSSSPPDMVYRVTGDGADPPTSLMSSYLYGQRFNAENSRPHTFLISPSVNTSLAIRVKAVSTAASAQLVVQVDDVEVTRLDLTAGTRDIAINVPLSAGTHTVILDNLGDDWLEIDYLEIPNYRAPLRALALADGDKGIYLVWLHHREYRWENVQAGLEREPYTMTLQIPRTASGNYRIEFWDPLSGNLIGEEVVTVAEGQTSLSLPLLPIDTQLALKIIRLDAQATLN